MPLKGSPCTEFVTSGESISEPVGKKQPVEEQLVMPFKKPPEPMLKTSHASGKALATPATRKLAKELGVEIRLLQIGKEGRVTEADVVHFHAQTTSKKPQPSPGKRAAPEIQSSTPLLHMPDDEVLLIGLRHIVAEKMVESKYIIPHYSFFDRADATRLVKLKEKVKAEAEKVAIEVTYMPFFIRALSLALKKYPQVNGSMDLHDKKLVIHKHHNIGIAKSTKMGLVVCVLKNVQDMSLQTIIKEYHALMIKAKEGKLDRSDMVDSTITISNFGVLGGMWQLRSLIILKLPSLVQLKFLKCQ